MSQLFSSLPVQCVLHRNALYLKPNLYHPISPNLCSSLDTPATDLTLKQRLYSHHETSRLSLASARNGYFPTHQSLCEVSSPSRTSSLNNSLVERLYRNEGHCIL